MDNAARNGIKSKERPKRRLLYVRVALKKIVVIGGTGHFGGRICRRIFGEPNTELVVTSRSLANARSMADEIRLSGTAAISAAQLDQTQHSFEADLTALNPDIVVHTAGPYQGQDYRVAKACIQAGSHYIDLADGRDFVQGFGSLHEEAQRRGLLLVAGASTLPGLSSAVINAHRDEFEGASANRDFDCACPSNASRQEYNRRGIELLRSAV